MKVIDKVSMPLSEIGHGKREVQFAFMNHKTGKTITPFVRCKDYFNDMFWCYHQKNSCNVCGFSWDSDRERELLSEKTLWVAVRLRDRDKTKEHFDITEKEFKGVTAIVSQFSEKLGFKAPEFEMDDTNKYIIIGFDRAWTEIPYLNSALFLLIRMGFTYERTDDPVKFFEKAEFISPNDTGYYRSAKKRLSDMFEGKVDKNQTYALYSSGSAAHGSSGIVAYSQYKV